MVVAVTNYNKILRCNKDKKLTDLKYHVSNLRHLSEYEFRVCAENAAGRSNFSDSSTLVRVQEPIYPPGLDHNLKILLESHIS